MIHTGDALSVLPTLQSESVQCCVTSPPYWGLRDYGVEGQLGLEKTPDEYVEKMVAVFREVKRVLRGDGTLWLNLGDSYNGSGKAGSNPEYQAKHTEFGKPSKEKSRFGMPTNIKALKPKDLVGIPWRVAFALQADGWWLRQDIIWAKPNPMPESVRDRCTKAHEYIFLLTKSEKYYYDAEAVKIDAKQSTLDRNKSGFNGAFKGQFKGSPSEKRWQEGRPIKNPKFSKDGKANLRSVWTITTRPFKEAHFATFPPEIPERCIKAGSKQGDAVLDPFSGAGTAGVVAQKLFRKFIGIEINPDYVKMSERRIEKECGGLFDE